VYYFIKKKRRSFYLITCKYSDIPILFHKTGLNKTYAIRVNELRKIL